jgi:hypothetical protein
LPRAQSLQRAQSLALEKCRRVLAGAPVEVAWFRKRKAATAAFAGLTPRKDGTLGIQMDVDAARWSAKQPYWTQKKRKGVVICPLPASGVRDLRNTEIEVQIVAPVAAVAHRWGSGVQVVLQDDRGRRMHGPWTGLSRLAGGRNHTLRFWPPSTAVPGMGFRHAGFDLRRVRWVGFGWAVGTFAQTRFKAQMQLKRVQLKRVQLKRVQVKRVQAGRSQKEPRLYTHGPARIWRPQPTRMAPVDLRGCFFRRVDYPYYRGLAPLVRSPFNGVDKARLKPLSLKLQMNPQSRFHKAGALMADLTLGCAGRPTAAKRLGAGALWDLAGRVIETRIDADGHRPVLMQIVFRDLGGRKCYSRKTARLGETLRIRLTSGPHTCAAGKGIDFHRIARIGIVLRLATEQSEVASKRAGVKTVMPTAAVLKRFLILAP